MAYLDESHHGYTATINKKRWPHIWSVLRKNTEVGEHGMAFNKDKKKVSKDYYIHYCLLVAEHLLILGGCDEKRSKREKGIWKRL